MLFSENIVSVILSYGHLDTKGLSDKIVIDAGKMAIQSKKTLLRREADIILRRETNELSYPCEKGCLPLLRFLLKTRIGINRRNAVDVAFYYKNYPEMEYLLRKTNVNTWRLISIVTEQGDLTAFKIITKYRKCSQAELQSSLVDFLKHGNLEAIKHCVYHRAIIDNTYLNRAILLDKVEIAEYFVDGLNIHSHGEECLRLACQRGNVPMVKMLISHGANINYEDGYVLRIAARNGNYEVCQLLLSMGLDIKSRYEDNLQNARDGYNKDIIRLFINHRETSKNE